MERSGPSNPQSVTRVNDAFPTRVTDSFAKQSLQGSCTYPFLRPPLQSDELGRLGNYRVLRLLGSGGMGIVFHAEDLDLHRSVALKVMKPELDSRQGCQRLLREARAMAAYKHDHLVTVYQVGQEGDLVYLAMELLDGETLEAWLGRVRQPDVRTMIRIGREIALGLAVIHHGGLVHRDIKPTNIWLEPRSEDIALKHPGAPGALHDPGTDTADSCLDTQEFRRVRTDSAPLGPNFRVKILDFGLARVALGDTDLTEPGIVVGTPAYLSPEQARGKPIDCRADLFSLGCVLYRMCTGRVPFLGTNALDQLAVLAADPPTPIEAMNPTVPDALAALVMDLLAKDPQKRPPSVQHVAQRLAEIQQALEGNGGGAVAPDPTERLPRLQGARSPLATSTRWVKRFGPPLLRIGAMMVIAALAILGLTRLVGPVVGDSKTYVADLKKVHVVNWPFHKMKEGKGEEGKGKDGKGKEGKGKDGKGKEGKGSKGPPPEIRGGVIVQGQPSPRGLFMHAAPPHDEPASITYHLDKQFRTFGAEVSLNDTAPQDTTPVVFSVFGDGKLLWSSQPVGSQAHAQSCTVDVKGVNFLKLTVSADGDVRGVHAVWIEPCVKK